MRKYLIPGAFFLLLFFTGCKSGDITSANRAFELYQFYDAAEMYKSVFNSTRNREEKGEIAFKAAESYRLMNDNRQAEQWYRRAIRMGYDDPAAILWLAEILKRNEKYDEALIEFQNYQKERPGDPKGEAGIQSVKNAIEWIENQEDTRYVVESFRPTNSRANDYAPMYFRNNALVFTSDRADASGRRTYGWTGQKHSDLFMIEQGRGRRADRWSDPVPLDGVNTSYNEGVATFDERGSVMYFTQCNNADGKGNNCKIMSSRRRGNSWDTPEPLPFCTEEDSIKYGHPALSPDGTKLYFSSDRPGGYGGHDLWVSFYVSRGRTWSEPVNLGPTINTEGDEMFPFIHADGTLYFSSNGHPGMGGLDIFYTTGEGVEWETPVNMKAPINSGGDDFAIILDETKESGFFSSNRPRSWGDDIYMFTMTPLIHTLNIIVYNSETGQVIPDAEVQVFSSTSEEVITVNTDASGSVKFEDIAKETDFEMFASKKQYFDSRREMQSTVGLKRSTDLYQELYIEPFLNVEIELPGIFYDLDRANIRPDAAKVLDSLIHILTRHPYIAIELGSHTDCRADSNYNINLSQRRADSAVAYLVRKGIHPERLRARGFGENQLTNDCRCEGSDIVQYTEYIENKTRKQIVTRTSTGYVVEFHEYQPSEILTIDGKKNGSV